MTNKAAKLENLKTSLEKEDLPLKESSKNLVFGKGNPEAKIMFVGEAPGKNEDLQGLPFVGAAGKNLDKLMSNVGLSINDVYITNILKYRPPENRDPNFLEIKFHVPYLIKQIEIIQPKVICSLGNYATKFFLAEGNLEKMESQPGITSVHGKVKIINLNGLKIKLIPLFHPAAIIYNRTLTALWEKDMEIVKLEKSKNIGNDLQFENLKNNFNENHSETKVKEKRNDKQTKLFPL